MVEEAEAGRREGSHLAEEQKYLPRRILECFCWRQEKNVKAAEKSGSLLGAPVNRHLRP